MKKILSVLMLILCCLLAFSACDNTPYSFYVNNALKIEVECKEYSLKNVDELQDYETYYKITADDFVSRYYLLDPDNDNAQDKEFYNDNGLYVYMYKRQIHVFCNDRLYDLTPKYFREHSQTYNQIEGIWAAKYDVEQSDVLNMIVGAVVFDGNVFILAQNDRPEIAFDREHTANLWKLDLTTGDVTFCGFCVSRDGRNSNLHFFGDGNLAIVKN